MNINVDELFGKMVTAGAQAFGAGWREVEKFAKLEFKTLAQRIKDIGEGLANGDFDLLTAKLLTPTVSPLMIPLVYCHINSFQRPSRVEKPLPGGENRIDERASHPGAL